MDELNIQVQEIKSERSKEAISKNHYFDNKTVEHLVISYVNGGCVDIHIRDEIMSHASELIKQVIKTHKLNVIYKGRDGSAFSELFQVAYCVPPDTLVITDDGIKKIVDCLPNEDIGNCDFNIYGKDGLNKAIKFIKRKDCDVLDVRLSQGYEFTSTLEHPVLVLNESGPDWKKTGELKNGDFVAVQYGQNVFGNIDKIDYVGKWKECPLEWTEDLAYIIGMIISEGSIGENKLVICNSSEEVHNRILSNNVGLKFTLKNNKLLILSGSSFIDFLTHIGIGHGTYANSKHIPNCLFGTSKNIQIQLLKGMFDGDGHSSRFNGSVGYTSTSHELIKQLRMLLLNFGMISKTSYSKSRINVFKHIKKTYYSQVQPSWQVCLSTIDSQKFYNDIGFSIKRKQDKRLKLSSEERLALPDFVVNHLKNLIKNSGKSNYFYKKKFGIDLRCFLNNKHIEFNSLVKIMKCFTNTNDISYKYLMERIEEVGRIRWLKVSNISNSKSDTINVEVSNSNTYTINGIISHNCQIESTLYKFNLSPGHKKIFNMWSQVARTVILAYIKKENKDVKSNNSYKDHKTTVQKAKPDFYRLFDEAKIIFKNEPRYLQIIDAINHLYLNDETPHDGMIYKLVSLTGFPKKEINEFLISVKAHSSRFSDSPENLQSKIHRPDRLNYIVDEEDG